MLLFLFFFFCYELRIHIYEKISAYHLIKQGCDQECDESLLFFLLHHGERFLQSVQEHQKFLQKYCVCRRWYCEKMSSYCEVCIYVCSGEFFISLSLLYTNFDK